jgi:branched-chain amino acid transport system permease protein
MEYLLHIIILIGIYAILATSLNLVSGYTGLLSIGHAAFYGTGAYVAALMALSWYSPFWLSTLCAIVVACLLGALVAVPALRMRGDYFAIATLAFQTMSFSVFNNWDSLTRGPLGLAQIPKPVVLGLEVSSHGEFVVLVLSFCALTLGVAHRIVRSPVGRVLKAIREDEVLAQAVGKNVAAYKVLVFVTGAGMAATAGSLYAHYISFIDPTSFTVMESIFILSIVIIGGAGSLWGPVLGAVVLVTLPELLRFVGLPSSVAANVRQILYGGLLVAFMMWRPQGFLGKYSFEKGSNRG